MRGIVFAIGLILPMLAPLDPEVPVQGQFTPCNPRVQQCG